MLSLLGVIFAFIINVMGSVTFFGLLAFAAWVLWTSIHH